MNLELESQVADIPNFTHPDVVSMVWVVDASVSVSLSAMPISCSQRETMMLAELSTLTAQNQVNLFSRNEMLFMIV